MRRAARWGRAARSTAAQCPPRRPRPAPRSGGSTPRPAGAGVRGKCLRGGVHRSALRARGRLWARRAEKRTSSTSASASRSGLPVLSDSMAARRGLAASTPSASLRRMAARAARPSAAHAGCAAAAAFTAASACASVAAPHAASAPPVHGSSTRSSASLLTYAPPMKPQRTPAPSGRPREPMSDDMVRKCARNRATDTHARVKIFTRSGQAEETGAYKQVRSESGEL